MTDASHPGTGDRVSEAAQLTHSLPNVYVASLLALVVTGVSACGWVLHYTEWFGVVGGLLGLGGLFAWVAFVSGLLAKSRKEALQLLFEERVLLRRRTTWVCLGVWLLVVALSLCSGTIVLDAQAEQKDRMVSVFDGSLAAPASPRSRARLPGGSLRRLWFFTPPWGQTLRVKVDGLPGLRVHLQPPFRTALGVPVSFLSRPLLIARLENTLGGTAAASPGDHELRVRIGSDVEFLSPFAGQTVWIGSEADVPVPERLVRQWREELAIAAVRDAASGEAASASGLDAERVVLARWESPLAVLASRGLQVGDTVDIELLRRSDKAVRARADVVVRMPSPSGEPAQEVYLR